MKLPVILRVVDEELNYLRDITIDSPSLIKILEETGRVRIPICYPVSVGASEVTNEIPQVAVEFELRELRLLDMSIIKVLVYSGPKNLLSLLPK